MSGAHPADSAIFGHLWTTPEVSALFSDAGPDPGVAADPGGAGAGAGRGRTDTGGGGEDDPGPC